MSDECTVGVIAVCKLGHVRGKPCHANGLRIPQQVRRELRQNICTTGFARFTSFLREA